MTIVDIMSICNQRTNSRKYNIPPIRYTPPSPYVQSPQFSKLQLDMRRKAEILKYASNKSTSQTNSLTKSQKWAQIASGKFNSEAYTSLQYKTLDVLNQYNLLIVNYPNKLVVTPTDAKDPNGIQFGNTKGYYTYRLTSKLPDCSTDKLIPTPTSSSDIPGPITYLIDDERVPLYNYSTTNNQYAIINLENKGKWTVDIDPDIYYNLAVGAIMALMTINTNYIEQHFMNLYIQPSIESTTHTFQIKCPISMFVSETATDAALNNLLTMNMSLQINYVQLSVYFNDTLVLSTSPNDVLLDATDIAYRVNFTPTANDRSYSIRQYMGMLTISNIKLPTKAGNLYDFHLSIGANYVSKLIGGITQDHDTYLQNLNYGVIANVSNALQSQQSHNIDGRVILTSTSLSNPNIVTVNPAITPYSVLSVK